MELLIYVGAFTTLVGIAGLILCGIKAAKVKSESDPEAARQKLHWLVALNMGSLGVAGIGLAMVVVGLLL